MLRTETFAGTSRDCLDTYKKWFNRQPEFATIEVSLSSSSSSGPYGDVSTYTTIIVIYALNCEAR
jgi:hypothetical protein